MTSARRIEKSPYCTPKHNTNVEALAADNRQANLVQANLQGVLDIVIANPAAFGFTNVTQACLGSGPGSSVCANPNAFLFFDTVHPTADESWERARSKAEKIRAKLRQPGFIAPEDINCFPDKPKWMRWRTYEHLKAKDQKLLDAHETGFCVSTIALIERVNQRR